MVLNQRKTGIAVVDKTVKDIYEVLEYLDRKINRVRPEIESGGPVLYFKNWRIRELSSPTRLFIEYDVNQGEGERDWQPYDEKDPLT